MSSKAEGGWLKKSYWGFVQGENFLRHFLLLIIRLYWGALLVVTGIGKWMHISGVIDFFTSLGIPAPVFAAYLTATIELLGGISLFLGLFSRFFSFLLSILFFVAYATAHHEAIANIFSNPEGFIKEQPFLYLYASLIVLCFGPGLFSIDWWLERRAFGKPL